MANKDAFDDRRKAQEEEYFRKKEQELIEQMRKRAEAEKERAEISEVSGIVDTEVLQSLQELGLTRETVLLLHLVPLVHMAWIDGDVSARERDLIFDVATVRGVVEGSAAHEKLGEWLSRRPSEDLFEKAMEIIGILIQNQSDAAPKDLVELVSRVANASGGILGLGRRVSGDEKALIERIASTFAAALPDAAREVVDKAD
jgi:hypothetical protein